MIHELYISGQRVDLSADTAITLEWVSGLFEDIGSIQMSRSYTVSLPKTARNLQILDDPGNPAHYSEQTRRYLDAQYIRNGFDLLGKARAYVIDVKSDAIEVALLWNIVPGLLEWKEAGKKLQDIPVSPLLPWVGTGGVPNYAAATNNDFLFFPRYLAGLDSYTYPTVNAATHPAVSFWWLFTQIFGAAGIKWDAYIDDEATEPSSLYYTALLCDGSRPNRAMEIASGSRAASATAYKTQGEGEGIVFNSWTHGWDPVVHEYAGYDEFRTGEDKNIRVIINLKNGLSDYTIGTQNRIRITNATRDTIAEYAFEVDANGVEHCFADEILDLSGLDTFRVEFSGAKPNADHPLTAYNSALPAFAVMHNHEAIVIEKQNTFPIVENLPDMSQVDFIKGACALFGLVAYAKGETLKFTSYEDLFDTTDAVDWTDKVSGELEVVRLRIDGRARKNIISYEEDVKIVPLPDAQLVVEDETLPETAELYKLPFAASDGSLIKQYEVEESLDDETGEKIYELTRIDVKPRVMRVTRDSAGIRRLLFTSDLKGEGLVSTYYRRFQNVIRRPVVVEAVARLNEVDLAGLDFARPVYLAQTGQYYAIKRVQSDGSELCKVELIQIA